MLRRPSSSAFSILGTSSSKRASSLQTLVHSSSTTNSVRNYALPKNPTPQEENYMIEAIKDYVRPVTKPRIPKTPQQFKKDEMLANAWSSLKGILTEKARKDHKRRLKLKKAALEALPKELRVEAEKIDWSLIPIQLGVQPHKDLPGQPGYKPPEEPPNIEV
ncbi:hypothetical protein FDP41_004145 [Naegleria fowleri]|uniref:Uncharacterized protein n=1 Tax=Naegleria fowleri TaxID=5763 RepID=A0A6A5BST2_NAEFO|nr:uncharacterized protein FDP41_004145 [Naegleria fowleri]KAF0976850.1 hypothetical protein FDP41_004145 [Naegleria fowleri]CAG4709391.1 unnamed protein product [Naegleria fowleri]